MEKQIILTANTVNASAPKKASDMVQAVIKGSLAKRARRAFRGMAALAGMTSSLLKDYYSAVLEREVSRDECNAITRTVVSFMAFVLPADYPLLLRAAACAWFLLSLRRMRRFV